MIDLGEKVEKQEQVEGQFQIYAFKLAFYDTVPI